MLLAFLNELQSDQLWYSDEQLDVIKKTYPQCKPGNKPSRDLISIEEDMYRNKRYSRNNSPHKADI